MRQVTTDDAAHIMEISYYDGIPATTLHEAMEMQERINQDHLQGNSIHWAIIDAKNSILVGTCGYYRGFANQTGELGYVLKPSYIGNGYMTNALRQAIDFGLNTIGLKKIIATTDKENTKSQNVLKRLGFVEEKHDGAYITYAFQV